MTVYTPGGPCLTKTQHDEQVFQQQWLKGTLNSAGKAQNGAGGSASASQSTTNASPSSQPPSLNTTGFVGTQVNTTA